MDVAVVTPFVDYMRNFRWRLSFTFQITLSSRLMPVQKLWLLLCSIISHDFRLLQCMTATQQLIRYTEKNERKRRKCVQDRENERGTCRKQNLNSIY